jgi:FkbM family methyltransferase
VRTERLLRPLTTALRRARGGVFVGEALRRLFRHRSDELLITDFDGDLSLWLDLSEHMQGQIFWHGYYSVEVVGLIKKILREGDVIFDCGANIGEITLIAAKTVGVTGKVFSFEPLPEIADQFDRNVRANGFENVEALRLGVARGAGPAPIFVASDLFSDGSHHDGLGTLFRSSQRSRVVGEISLISIDEFVGRRKIERIDLIKLDIEGGELAALQGAETVLKTLRPSLIVEMTRETCEAAGYRMEELYSFIVDKGYAVHRIGRWGSLHKISQSDLLDFQNVYCVAE